MLRTRNVRCGEASVQQHFQLRETRCDIVLLGRLPGCRRQRPQSQFNQNMERGTFLSTTDLQTLWIGLSPSLDLLCLYR